MRLTRELLEQFMRRVARGTQRSQAGRVYFIGGGTAVLHGWRESTIDVDFHTQEQSILANLQGIKERLRIYAEFVCPEHFVPAIAGSEGRHVSIATYGAVSFYHYDPYAQVLSKVVRGFRRDVEDARQFVMQGSVDPTKLQTLVEGVSETEFAGYPALSRKAVLEAVRDFVADLA